MKQSDAYWKITLLHSLQEVRAIYKTRNQLRCCRLSLIPTLDKKIHIRQAHNSAAVGTRKTPVIGKKDTHLVAFASCPAVWMSGGSAASVVRQRELSRHEASAMEEHLLSPSTQDGHWIDAGTPGIPDPMTLRDGLPRALHAQGLPRRVALPQAGPPEVATKL